jgi:capsular exopolysaccharide synthesis family protein
MAELSQPAAGAEPDGPLASTAREGLSLAEIGSILFKRRWLLLVCVGVALIVGYVYSKTRIPLYEGAATIDLNPSQTNVGLSDLIQESLSSEDTRMPTEVARMQSNRVIFQTIKDLAEQHRGPFPTLFDHRPADAGMDSFPAAELEGMIGQVRGSLAVGAQTGTDIVSIRYQDPRPDVARDVPNAIVEVYLKRNLDDHMEGTGRVTRWLASQMDALKAEANAAQARLADYQRQHRLIQVGGLGGTSGAESLELDRLRVSNSSMAAEQADRIIREAKLRLAESNDPDLVATVEPNSPLTALRAQLMSLRAQYTQLSTRYGPRYPRVRELQSQMAAVQSQINAEMRSVQRRVREQYDNTNHTLNLMQRQLDEEMQGAYRLNDSAAQYALLRQDAESSRQLYDQLELKLKESNLAAGLNTASVTVIDEALLPLAPVSPDVHANMMISAGLGLLVGVLGAFLLESLDDTLRSTDDVELFAGLLSIGAIPHFQPARGARAEETGEEPGERRRLVSITAPASPTAEAYRALRSSVLLSAIDNPLRTLVVTSAFMSEGKSTLSANLAVMLAQRGERVLIVDADLRRSTLHLLFGLRRPASGLTNLLSRQSDESVILHPLEQVPTLAYLPAGAVPPNPAELLASHRMSEMMRQWSEQYDRVILDTAPILAVSDSLAPAARADSVLLVVRAGVTRKKALLRTRELLRRVNAPLLGVVVNDVEASKGGYYDYSGPYSYGYGYTSESLHEEVR